MSVFFKCQFFQWFNTKHRYNSVASLFSLLLFQVQLLAQGVSINTTGTPAAVTNMLEVSQSNTTNNSIAIDALNSGNITGTGYGIRSQITGTSTTNIASYFNATGATNNYSLIVPSGGGNVGIGTTSPGDLLTLYNSTDPSIQIISEDGVGTSYTILEEASTQQLIVNKVTATSNSLIDINAMPSNGTSNASVRLFRETNTTGEVAFSVLRGNNTVTTDHKLTAGTSSNSFLAAQGGNVGIGITSPTSVLHVDGGGIEVDDVDYGIGFRGEVPQDANVSTDGGRIYTDNDFLGGSTDALVIEKTDSDDNDPDGLIAFTLKGMDNTREAGMVLLGNGNVGVGTTAPTTLFHLASPFVTTSTIVIDNTGTAYPNGEQLDFASEGQTSARVKGNQLVDRDNGYLTFHTMSGGTLAEHMTIREDGKVGIGHANPDQLLTLFNATNPGIRIYSEDGAGTSWSLLEDVSTSQVQFNKVCASGQALLDINMSPSDGTSQANVRMFRTTNTSGEVSFSLMRGDNTATTDHKLISGTNGDSYFAANGGNIGIGTTSPGATLEVDGDAKFTGAADVLSLTSGAIEEMTMGIRDGNARFSIYQNAKTAGDNYINSLPANRISMHDDGIKFYTAASGTAGNPITWNERVRIQTDGNVGIGNTSPSHKLEVTGTAGLSTGTTWTNTSDVRLKDIHGDYEYGLSEIVNLTPIRFNYKKGNPVGLPSEHQMIGFAAQEVQKFIPDAVTQREDGYLQLNVDPIHWAAINSIKELNTKMEAQQKIIQELLKERVEVQERLNALESQSSAISKKL